MRYDKCQNWTCSKWVQAQKLGRINIWGWKRVMSVQVWTTRSKDKGQCILYNILLPKEKLNWLKNPSDRLSREKTTSVHNKKLLKHYENSIVPKELLKLAG